MIRSKALTEQMVLKLAQDFLDAGYVRISNNYPQDMSDKQYDVIAEQLKPSLELTISRKKKSLAKGYIRPNIKSEAKAILEEQHISYDDKSKEYRNLLKEIQGQKLIYMKSGTVR
jgi:hypothetical protein